MYAPVYWKFGLWKFSTISEKCTLGKINSLTNKRCTLVSIFAVSSLVGHPRNRLESLNRKQRMLKSTMSVNRLSPPLPLPLPLPAVIYNLHSTQENNWQADIPLNIWHPPSGCVYLHLLTSTGSCARACAASKLKPVSCRLLSLLKAQENNLQVDTLCQEFINIPLNV